MGVIGILVRGKRLGYVSEVRSDLDALRHKAGFYIDQQLYDRALELASER